MLASKDGAVRLTMNVLELIFVLRSIHLLHNDPIFQLATRYRLVLPNRGLHKVGKDQQRHCDTVTLIDFGSYLVFVKKQQEDEANQGIEISGKNTLLCGNNFLSR